MNKYFIFLFYFSLIIFYCDAVSKVAKGPQTGVYYYNSGSSWTPTGVPVSTDDVGIPVSTLVAFNYDITVNTLSLGVNGGSWGGLETNGSIYSTSTIKIFPTNVVNKNSYIAFLPSTSPKSFGSGDSHIYLYSLLYVLSGATINFNSASILYCFPNSIFQNEGSVISSAPIISDSGSSIYNFNEMVFGDNLLLGAHSFQPFSRTYFGIYSDNGINSQANAYFEFLNSSISTCYSNVYLQENTKFFMIDGSKFEMINEKFDYGNTSVDAPITSFKLFNASQVQITDSLMTLDGAYIVTLDNSIFFLNNSQVITNNTILARDTSTIYLTRNSNISSIGFLMADGHSELLVENSSIQIVDNTFGLFENSNGNFYNSQFTITVDNENRGILGTFNSSKLQFFENSHFQIQGVFLCYDQTILNVNSSKIVVGYLFFLDNNAIANVVQGSTMEILNIFAVRGNSFFNIEDSTLQVTSNITFYQNPKFNFKNSNISVDGLFDYRVTNMNNNNNIIDSNVNVNGNFSNSGNISIVNSKVDVNGNFSNIGSISMSKSFLNVYANFSTTGSLYLREQSKIVVEKGTFYSDKLLDGLDSVIQVNNGIIEVEDQSIFNCVNCNITILNGYFKQGIDASINLTNTIFYNQERGTVEAFGVIQFQDGGISNDGDFILKSDIISTGSASFSNQGSFSITGETQSNINTNFNNNGEVNVQQNTKFSNFVQTSGSISLSSDVSSDNVFSVNGGSVIGTGIINTAVDNNGGTFGSSKNIDQITITGNYNQSTNSSMKVTVDGKTSGSKIIINGNATLDGTIYVRVNEDLVNSATANVSIEVVNHASTSSGTFKNVVIITYNKETKTDTIVNNDCKIKTQHSSTSFALLLTPNDDRESCGQNGSSESTKSSSKKKISTGAIIGIVVGIVGLAAIICGIYVVKHKSDFQILNRTLKTIPLENTTKI